MTIPLERRNAVIRTQDFLLDLTDPKKTPRVPTDVRKRAISLLRHYPSSWDMETAGALEDDPECVQARLGCRVFSNKF